MTFVDYVHDLFKKYYEGKRNRKDVSLLRSAINELVLTGEQIMESGITDVSEIYEEANEEVEELKDKIEMRKRVYQTLKESYQELKSTQQEENLKSTPKESHSNYKLSAIERIIRGRNGPFIDEIREVIK